MSLKGYFSFSFLFAYCSYNCLFSLDSSEGEYSIFNLKLMKYKLNVVCGRLSQYICHICVKGFLDSNQN